MTRQDELARLCVEEQDRITTMRLFAWTRADHGDRICRGVRLQPLTLRKWLDLLTRKNALFSAGRAPERKDYLDYIWTASSRYRLRGIRARWAAWRFRRSRVCQWRTDILERIAENHIEQNFFDIPRCGGGGSSSLPAVEPIISNVIELSSFAGIDPESAFDWPIVRAFAVIREANVQRDDKYKAPIPHRLDKLQTAWAREISEQHAAAGKAWD